MTATATAIPKPTRPKVERVKAKITKQVIVLLGSPNDLYRIDVHLYRPGRARINIWRRELVHTEKKGGFLGALGQPELTEITRITDSFYLHLSKSATIETTSPAIQRRY